MSESSIGKSMEICLAIGNSIEFYLAIGNSIELFWVLSDPISYSSTSNNIVALTTFFSGEISFF